jgi:hypothetical protein
MTELHARQITPRLHAAVLTFAMLFPALGAWLYFVVFAGAALMKPAYLISKLVQFALPVVWVVGVERQMVRPTPPRVRGIAAGLGSGLAMLAGLLAIYYGYFRHLPALADAPRAINEKLAGFGVDRVPEFLALAVFYSALHSLLEEYYWRWFVFGQLERRMRAANAVVLSSLAFMAHHVLVIGEFLGSYGLTTWLFSLGVALGGAWWALLYRWSRSLYGPWVSHMLVDVALMGIGYELWRAAASN